MTKSIKPIDVTLLGKTFRVACPADQEMALYSAADYLERKMRDIQDSGRILGIDRIAVLAGLNIAHEFLNGRSTTEDYSELVSERVEKLQNRIDATLRSVTQSLCID